MSVIVQTLCESVTLPYPDLNKEYQLYMDTSDFATDVCLTKVFDDTMNREIEKNCILFISQTE